MPFAGQTVVAGDVRLGAFQLPQTLIAKIDQSEPLLVSLGDVPDDLAENLRTEGGTEANSVQFYWSAETDTTEPSIGDARIRFQVTRPADVSILSQQVGNSLQPFKTDSGRELNMLSYGTLTANAMITNAEAANTTMTWGLRIFGIVLMCAGIGLVLRPLSSLSEGIPLIGNVVGFGVAVIAIVAGGAGSLMVISIAWLLYRPLIALLLLAVAVGLIVFLVQKLRQRTVATAAEPADAIVT